MLCFLCPLILARDGEGFECFYDPNVAHLHLLSARWRHNSPLLSLPRTASISGKLFTEPKRK